MKPSEKWYDDLHWYVLIHDFNEDKIVRHNIFNNIYVHNFIIKYFKKFISFDDFVKELDGTLMYAYWSKSEYEILCRGLYEKYEEQKLDVYYQLELNIKPLAKYIIDTYNNRPYAKKQL